MPYQLTTPPATGTRRPIICPPRPPRPLGPRSFRIVSCDGVLKRPREKHEIVVLPTSSPHVNALFGKTTVLLVPLLPGVGERLGFPLVPGCAVGGHRGMPGRGPPRRQGGSGGRRNVEPPVRLGAPSRQVYPRVVSKATGFNPSIRMLGREHRE